MNIGLLGYGFMGKTHAYAIHNLKYFYKSLPFDAKITAVCTAHIENAVNAVNEYNLGEAYDNEDDVIFNPDIDIIDISTPNVYHYNTLKKALSAGKHIYCEKPLCVTYAQAREIADIAKNNGVIGRIVFNYRFMAPVMRAKQLIEENRLGDILSFRCAYRHSTCCDPTRPAGWKQNRDICGGGVLFDLGSHAADLMYYLCGEFQDVQGKAQIAHSERAGMDGKAWKTNADEAFYMIAKMKNGAVGTIEANKLAVGTNDDLVFEIFGTHGAIKFDLMDPNWLYFYDDTVKTGDFGGDKGYVRIECVNRYPAPGGVFPSVKAPVGWLRGHIESYYSFLNGVYEYSVDKIMPAISPDFDNAAHIQWVMEEAYRSAGMSMR